MRILVAEDDHGVRSLIGTTLHRAGYQVEFAADGLDTIEKLTAGSYDAILLDLMMPGASGFEVLAWMHRTRRDEAKRRVIVVTAMSSSDLKNLTSDRVFAVIRKPFDIDELVRTVRDCVGAASA